MIHRIPLTFLLIVGLLGCTVPDTVSVSSPDGDINLVFEVIEGVPQYHISRDGTAVQQTSQLGLLLDKTDLSKNVEISSVTELKEHKESYELLHGKQKEITYIANERTVTLEHTSGQKYDIIFRVSDDGVAFRYFIDGKADKLHYIHREFTSFNVTEGARFWLEPLANVNTGWSQTNPSYEEYYYVGEKAGIPAPDSAGWAFPALFQIQNTFVLISETGMDGSYPATRLHQHAPDGEYQIRFPQAEEQFPGRALNPESALPWSTPWRLIAIGDLETIAESTLGTDLADSSQIDDPSWIKPGRAAWSWAKLKDNSVNYDTQIEFIDYAAKMGWEYVLVDVNWDQTIGYDRMQELADYAAGKDVGLILWYNSSGSWNTTEYTPKSKLLTHEDRVKEFSRIEDIGIKGVKVDFFAGDGQSMMSYYLDIFEDAADHHLLVNTHGTTLPRGWHRTWPNLVTMESVKGFEFTTFDQRNADQVAVHSTTLPFTRNVFSPMDYTPMSPTPIPNIDRITTSSFELAQPIIFTSGVLHVAETAEGMYSLPEYVQEYASNIPVSWDETRFLQGYPGKLVVFARRTGDEWFIAGLNGENIEKEISIDLSFIPDGLNGTFIGDGKDQYSYSHKTISTDQNELTVQLSGNGGFVIHFE